MKKLSPVIFVLFASLVSMCIISCDGCNDKVGPWLDEHTIEIPKADNTPPTAWFEITDSKTGETTQTDKDLVISKTNGTQLDIVFWGKDEDSGIKQLCISHGFRQECCTINADPRLCSISQPLSANQCIDMPVIDTRAFISWFMLTEIYVSLECGTDWELISGSYSLTGTVTNSLGVSTSIGLGVTVED